MVGLTHLAVGLASKRVTPNISIWILVFCTYFIDILYLIFILMCFDQSPLPDQVISEPWSHNLVTKFSQSS